jgi:PAS domain S-box-containing protein
MTQHKLKKHRKAALPQVRGTGAGTNSGIPDRIPMPVLQFDRAGLLARANADFLRLLGATPRDVAGVRWLQYVDAKERREVGDTIAAAAAARQPFKLTCHLQTADDATRTYEIIAQPVLSGKRFTGYMSSAVDVTGRDNAVSRAIRATAITRGLIEHCHDLYFVVDDARRIMYWNSAVAHVSGRREDEVVGMPLQEILPHDIVLHAVDSVCATKIPRDLHNIAWPGHSLLHDCKVFPVASGCGVILTPDRQSSGTAAYEALRQSEERLRQNEERYRAFIENSSEGIWRFELAQPIAVDESPASQVRALLLHATVAECNDMLARFFDCPRATDLINARLSDIVLLDPNHLEEVLTRFVTSGYRVSNIEAVRRTIDGEPRYFLYNLSGTIEHGHVIQVWGVLSDVTERRVAERRLGLLAHALTSTRDAISITDMENRMLFVNGAFVHTYGFPEEDLLGSDMSLVRSSSSPPALDEEIRIATLKGGWYGEILNRRSDGKEFPVELWTSVVRNDEGDPVAMVGVARDITERKQTEENLRSSLKEKEVLLREIHHRVKNNLQVITSLLSLQAEYLTDETMTRIMRESQHRVRSMALVHEKIYQSHNLAEVDFGDYTRELVSQLFRSYGAKQDLIRMNIRADSVSLGVDRAIPCGIILNELVTNSLKYAFPGGRTGNIDIELRSVAAGLIRLIVRDDGVGFPQDFDMRKTNSLGLTLVHMLVDQVRGELTISPQPAGVEVTLTFRK